MKKLHILLFLLVFKSIESFCQGQPHLHTSSQSKECSFQLDPSLTQQAWHQFSKEASLVAYLRPLTGADPLGAGKIDISILQWQTRIDEGSEAWNNTFVHPDTTHWLVEGPRLAVPGLVIRAGITSKLDAGIYWTTNPQANYSIAGALLQYNFMNTPDHDWMAASRLSWSTIYGPRDLTFSIYGLDIVGSRKFKLYSTWLALTTYACVSVMFSHAHERTSSVNLEDEDNVAFQAAVGGILHLSMFQLAVEYNQGITNTLSYRMGIAFNLPRLAAHGASKTERKN